MKLHSLILNSALLGALLLGVLLAPDSAEAVPKTDVITLVNRDVITCEVREMVRGQVTAKTDNIGTIYIKWDKVIRLVSNYWFLISTDEGELIYGQMTEAPEDGLLVIAFQEKTTTIPMSSVVEIQPVRYDYWDRMNVSAALGFSWSKGSDVLQANIDTSVKYQGSLYGWGCDLTAMSTDKGEGDITRRNQLDLSLSREISGKFQAGVHAGTYRNDELGVRARVSGGLNLGYYLYRKSHLEWGFLAGATLNREWASVDEPPNNNAEGRLGTDFSLFFYDTPKTNLTVTANLYPNFTDSERIRFEANVSGNQEIIKNFYVKVQYYESRDNKPPAGATATSDRGIVFSLEWIK